MASDKEIRNLLNSIIGIKESEVKPTTIDIFDVSKAGVDETELPFSTQSTLSPTEETPVGAKRVKETGITTGKTGTTFLGLAETGTKDIQEEGKLLKGPGEIVTPDEATENLERKIQESRPRIEKDLKAGTVFTEIKPNESFEAYYERVKKDFPKGSLQSLKDEAAKQYALRFPEYKALAKNPDLMEAILSEANFDVDDYIGESYEKGMKVRSKPSGVRGITTEALEKAGYITKDIGSAIDNAIESLIDEYPQEIEAQFQTNPKTGKAYTKNEVKRLLKTRFIFAASKYFNEGVKPKMIEEIMEKMRGSFSAVNAPKVAERIAEKVRPKYVTPFLTSMLGVIKSGQASDLLMAGTKAAGIGIPLELMFAPEAEAGELFDENEMSDLRIALKFGGEEGYKQKEEEILKNRGIAGL